MWSHQPGYTCPNTNGAVMRIRIEPCSEVSAPYGSMWTLKKMYVLQRTSPEMGFIPYTGFRAQCLKFYICLLFLNFCGAKVAFQRLSKPTDESQEPNTAFSRRGILNHGHISKPGDTQMWTTQTAFPLCLQNWEIPEGYGFCSFCFLGCACFLNFGCVCF